MPCINLVKDFKNVDNPGKKMSVTDAVKTETVRAGMALG